MKKINVSAQYMHNKYVGGKGEKSILYLGEKHQIFYLGFKYTWIKKKADILMSK